MSRTTRARAGRLWDRHAGALGLVLALFGFLVLVRAVLSAAASDTCGGPVSALLALITVGMLVFPLCALGISLMNKNMTRGE